MQIEVPDDLGEQFRLLVSSRTFETTPDEYAERLIERELGRYHADGFGERDKLTGCHTRNQFDADLNHRLSAGPPAETHSFHFLCFDIDGLRRHSNAHGHPEADRILREVADALREAYPIDLVYWVGGDEFIVVLRDSGYRVVSVPDGVVLKHCAVNVVLSKRRGWSLEEGGAIRLYLGRGLSEARPEGTSLTYNGEPLSVLPVKPSLWFRISSSLRSAPDKGKPVHR